MRLAALLVLLCAAIGISPAQAANGNLVMGMPVAAFTAMVAAAVALISVAANALMTWWNFRRQKDLTASNALTAYQFEARKRLYTECEPLFFQLSEACEQAFQTCVVLGRRDYCDKLAVNREPGRDPESWMMCRATETIASVYNFLRPLALLFLLRDKMTRVDCTLDPEISLQYRLARLLMQSLQEDHCVAALDPVLPYDPHVPNWRSKRLRNPARYWWQGTTPGRLDRAVRMALSSGEPRRTLTYGEFEDRYIELYRAGDRDGQKTLGVFANPFYGFTPDTRPVFWRLVVIQAHLHHALSRPMPKNFSRGQRTPESVRRAMALPRPERFDLGPDKGWPVRRGPADRTPDTAMNYLVGQLAD